MINLSWFARHCLSFSIDYPVSQRPFSAPDTPGTVRVRGHHRSYVPERFPTVSFKVINLPQFRLGNLSLLSHTERRAILREDSHHPRLLKETGKANYHWQTGCGRWGIVSSWGSFTQKRMIVKNVSREQRIRRGDVNFMTLTECAKAETNVPAPTGEDAHTHHSFSH